MTRVVPFDYQGEAVSFTADGWINATAVAASFGKRLDHWLANAETQKYLSALAAILNTRNPGDLVRTRRGHNGGTWLHPKLGVVFARWLDVRFAVWCDARIDDLLRGPGLDDWCTWRADASATFRVMTDAVFFARQLDGKETRHHHYSNEARLVCWALTGQFATLDRSASAEKQLQQLTLLEQRNTFFLARDVAYEERKAALRAYGAELRGQKAGRLAGGGHENPEMIAAASNRACDWAAGAAAVSGEGEADHDGA
ncbi:KilA-N domain-containing protein [Cupriavidus sp. PET2-C1]